MKCSIFTWYVTVYDDERVEMDWGDTYSHTWDTETRQESQDYDAAERHALILDNIIESENRTLPLHDRIHNLANHIERDYLDRLAVVSEVDQELLSLAVKLCRNQNNRPQAEGQARLLLVASGLEQEPRMLEALITYILKG
jgi:hypothetical protein